MTGSGNIFDGLPDLAEGRSNMEGEQFNDLLTLPGVRIERIVSTGQSSPPGFWYEQTQAEWVLLIAGSATLRFEDEEEPRHLIAGDNVFIAPSRRHRVETTTVRPPTIWLAVWIETDH